MRQTIIKVNIYYFHTIKSDKDIKVMKMQAHNHLSAYKNDNSINKII